MRKFFLLLFIFQFQLIAADKPNFVFFLIDDMGRADIGAYGSKFHETPNIDKIAADGMKFMNGYSACTVCSPSRAAIITGQYPGRLHLTDWIAGHNKGVPKLKIPDWKMYMDHSLTTMPEALKEAGYNTAFIGKWHLMPYKDPKIFKKHFPEDHGFDVNIGGREWGQPKGRGKFFFPFDMPNVEGKKGDYLTDVLTDKAVEYINKQSADKPFLLYFSYYVLHGPLMTKKDYLKKYETKLAGAKYVQNRPVYAGMAQSMDESVGRVLKAIKDKGFEDNTVVIFTADNGGVVNSSSGGLRGAKALSYEGGTRVATLVKWPGVVKAGSTSDVPVIGMDFYPTMLSMAGLALRPKDHIDGMDITPALKGGNIKRDSLYWHYPHYHKTKPYGAIRYKNYKLIEFFEDGNLELYDLKNDEAETKNLATAQPEKAQQLLKKLKDWRKSVNAQMMTPNPAYDPNKPPVKKKKKPKKKKK